MLEEKHAGSTEMRMTAEDESIEERIACVRLRQPSHVSGESCGYVKGER
jgi:hypothetical protein